MGLGDWARIVCGTDQGLDEDITTSSPTNPFKNWAALADRIYLKAKPLALQMTDTEKLSLTTFLGGGTDTMWPHAGGSIEYYRRLVNNTAIVFVPEVIAPNSDAPKDAPTVINPFKVYVYLSSSGTKDTFVWQLPSSWVGKHVSSSTITPSGRQAGPKLSISGSRLSLVVQPGYPIVLIMSP